MEKDMAEKESCAKYDRYKEKLDDLEKFILKIIEEKEVARKEALELARHENEARIALANSQNETRLAGLNHLKEDRDQLVKLGEYNIKVKYYDEFVMIATNKFTAIETRHVVWTSALAIFFTVLTIVVHIFWK
jgi:hypothetical protein